MSLAKTVPLFVHARGEAALPCVASEVAPLKVSR